MFSQKPYLSVGICTYNRQKFIGACLHCLSLQTLPIKQWEIIAVDNNSTDNSATIIKDFIAKNTQLQANYFFEPNQGLSYARNRCVTESKGQIIVYIDDDVEVATDYLEQIYNFFTQNPQAVGAGGKTHPKYSERSEPKWMNKYLFGYIGKSDHGDVQKKYAASMKYPTGCNMMYRKEMIEKVGGFNNALKARADDKYIFTQISKLSSEIYYLPQAFSFHNIDAERLEFSSFKKLYLKTGNEERIRIKDESGRIGIVNKSLELVFKTAGSIVLWMLYLLKGKYQQGKYIFYSQYFTLRGFLKKMVFVR